MNLKFKIHRCEINAKQWVDTSLLRTDGKLEFREKPQYGNRHAVFDSDADWGTVHYDEFNALAFPNGTVDHLAKYTEEKTNIPKDIAKLGIVVGGILAGASIVRYLEDRL